MSYDIGGTLKTRLPVVCIALGRGNCNALELQIRHASRQCCVCCMGRFGLSTHTFSRSVCFSF